MDDDRRRKNAAKLRELIREVEASFWAGLREGQHFDGDIHYVVKDGVIQRDISVKVTHKKRLP